MQLFKSKTRRAAEKPLRNGKADVPSFEPDGKIYRPSEKEPFMNERQREYFRLKLLDWREDILKEAKETLQHLQDESQNHPDLTDRAAIFRVQKRRGARAGPLRPGPAPGIVRGFIGNRPSRCNFLRASLRARRTASAFSRTLFSEGFS